MGDRRAADRRPRPARAHVDIAARQSLREPAAHGAGAGGALAAVVVRGGACDPRRRRRDRCRSCAPPRDQVAERPLARRRKIRRPSDRRPRWRRRRQRGSGRHRRQLRNPPHGRGLSGNRPGRGLALTRRAVRRAVGEDARLASRNGTQGRAFPPSARNGSRGRPVSARMCACVFPAARSRAGSRRSTRRADSGLRLPDGAVTTVVAGDVFLRSAAPAEMTR